MYVKIVMSAWVLSLVTGCMTSYVDWLDKGRDDEAVSSGVYSLSGSFASSLANSGVKTGPIDTNAVPSDDSPLPVKVDIDSSKEKDTTGGLATFNNVFSYFTLGIWPCVESKQVTHTITLRSASGRTETVEVIAGRRKWSSFILPIGALPCPGWGDERGFVSGINPDGMLGLEFCRNEVRGLLSGDFYKTEMAKYVSTKKAEYEQQVRASKVLKERVESAIEGIQAAISSREKRRGSHGSSDRRAIVLLDSKDVLDKTSKNYDENVKVGQISAVMDELETTLSDLGFRVISKRSMSRSAEDRALWDEQTNKSLGELPKDVTIYRAEAVVFQYGVETKNSEKTNVGGGSIAVVRKSRAIGRVDMSLKFINNMTGETEYSIQHAKKEVVDEHVQKAFCKDGQLKDSGTREEPIVPEKILADALRETFVVVSRDIICKMKPFRVIDCKDSNEMIIDATEKSVKVGDRLQVLSVGKGKKRNGKVFRDETLVGVVKVTSVGDGSSTVVFESVNKVDCGWDVVLRPM